MYIKPGIKLPSRIAEYVDTETIEAIETQEEADSYKRARTP